jgi:hypothetical protein
MLARGLQDIEESHLYDMALHDVGMRYLNEIRAAGFPVSTASQLMDLRVQNVTPDYARQMRHIFDSITINDLINLDVQNVTPEYAREIRQMYPTSTVRDIVNMKVSGVRMSR